jgi:hypothetical protein
LKAFLAKRPSKPVLVLPDPWDVGPRFILQDMNKDRKPDVLAAGGLYPEAFFFDLDGSTSRLAMMPWNVSMLVRKKRWESEVIVDYGHGEYRAFYDRDNDDVLDTILLDRDGDEKADVRLAWTRAGGWSVHDGGQLGPLLNPKLLKDAVLAKRFSEWMKKIEEELEDGTR